MYTRQALPGAIIDVAEIDPVVVNVAHEWFSFRSDARMRVHTGDGRAFIERAPPGAWDVIVLDAFSDDEIPFTLTTHEFLTAVRTSLADDGVVVSNLWTANPLHPSMVATYMAVFDQVRLIEVPRRRQQILVAGRTARSLDRPALVEAAARFDRKVAAGFDLVTLVRSGYDVPTSQPNVRILRDADAAR
jgi:spermidine synthase